MARKLAKWVLALAIPLTGLLLYKQWVYWTFDRVHQEQVRVAMFMKSALFMAMHDYKLAGFTDDDGNKVGEFGFFDQINYKDQDLYEKYAYGDELISRDRFQLSGYCIQLFLPDGRGGMYGFDGYENDSQKTFSAPLREECYLLLA